MVPEKNQILKVKKTLDNIQSSIETLKKDRKNLVAEIEILKKNKENNFNHRMSYLTWMTVNPISLIVVPPIFTAIFLLFILNSDRPFEKWKISELTNTAPIAITYTIFVLGVLNTFSNKYYQSIQDNCDMLIIQKLQLEMDKREAERDKREAEQKAERDKRDEKFQLEMKELSKQFIEIKTGQARIEGIQSVTPKQ